MEASAGCRHVLPVEDTRPCVDGEELRGAFVMVKMAGDLDKWLRRAPTDRRLSCARTVAWLQFCFVLFYRGSFCSYLLLFFVVFYCCCFCSYLLLFFVLFIFFLF
ncbi:unnamed protein product [Polarella glacialis]|uniref:Uncharacterized protein n=1 Tax=Polarella glacialis TaxID=89957 RepID=A0A813LBD6_POLGL|nr:unnamed protein product [Polarella glacialis]